MNELQKLKTQRKLMGDNEEVCAILDRQIAAMEKETNDKTKEIESLSEELNKKILNHIDRQNEIKQHVVKLREELKRKENIYTQELTESKVEVTRLRNKLNELTKSEEETTFNFGNVFNIKFAEQKVQMPKEIKVDPNIENFLNTLFSNFQQK